MNKEMKNLKKDYKQQRNYVGLSIIISGIVFLLMLLIFLFASGIKLSIEKYILGIIIIVLVIGIIYFTDYKITNYLFNHYQNRALKEIKQAYVKGKNPYPSPTLKGLMIGFCLVLGAAFFILSQTNWEIFSFNSLIIYLIAFVLGYLIGYFMQVRNLKKLKIG